MRHGFKSQCERHAVELRKQMGLPPAAPLNARELAARLGIIVWGSNEVQGISSEDLEVLTGIGRDEWSGFTLRLGDRRLIVVNHVQSPRRQNSVVAHELAHIILGHELPTALITDSGHLVPVTFGQEEEDEAAWFGATLLLPRPALIAIRQSRLSDEEAGNRFSVSTDLLQWRIRMTGIDYQLGTKVPATRRRV